MAKAGENEESRPNAIQGKKADIFLINVINFMFRDFLKFL